MSVRPIAGVLLRQLYLMRNNPVRVLPSLAWAAIDIVLWGFITRYLGAVAGTHIDFVASLLGAVLLWDFFSRVMQGVAGALLEDVWSRNFFNFFAAPLTIGEYLLGLVATSILTSLVGLAVMLALATAGFGLSFLPLGLALASFLLVLFLFGIALGVFANGLVLRFGPAAEWLVWPLPALVSPFAGVFYPLATLPAWMRGVARVLPPSYVFEQMRAILAGRPFSGGSLATGLVLAVTEILLACLFFVRVHRRAVRTGLLARYSAEGPG
jgi:ABC-2 type transport system permease protein